MPAIDRQNDQLYYHFGALAIGVLTAIVVFSLSGGLFDYLIMLVVAIVAVALGHKAIRRHGPFRWAAVVGIALSYGMLLLSAGLLLVRVIRILAGSLAYLG